MKALAIIAKLDEQGGRQQWTNPGQRVKNVVIGVLVKELVEFTHRVNLGLNGAQQEACQQSGFIGIRQDDFSTCLGLLLLQTGKARGQRVRLGIVVSASKCLKLSI